MGRIMVAVRWMTHNTRDTEHPSEGRVIFIAYFYRAFA